MQLDNVTDGHDGDFVAVDDVSGIRQIVAHVRTTGRSDLAYVGGDASSWSGQHRFNAFAKAEPAVGEDRVLLGEFSEQWGYQGGRRVLSLSRAPDAIICGNDLIAIGVIEAASELGKTSPGHPTSRSARGSNPPR